MRFASITDRLVAVAQDKWAIHYEARRRALRGEELIELTIGEPDAAPPQSILDAAIDALHRGRTRYTSTRGEAPVIEALSKKYSGRTGRDIGPHNIAYMTGTQAALYAALTVLVDYGDEVLVGDPLYATYEGVIRSTGADIGYVPLRPEHGFHMRAEDLEAKINPRSRVLLLNSPHNPTGATLTYEEIGAIVEVCKHHDLWIVSDEVYETMSYTGHFASPFDHPLGADRTVVVSSLSKSHMVPGFRAGWCIGPKIFIDRLLPLSEMMLFGAQPFIQDAAALALSQEFPECRAMVESFRQRAQLFSELLGNAPGLRCAMPEGGMFAMVDVSGTGLNGEDFGWRLLDEEKVAVMPGSSFGYQARNHIRVSLSADQALLREAAARMTRLALRLTREKAA